jgi:predicted DNA-binding transcriptional regulator YafY
VHYRNTWYLDAWCHATDGLRRFALDAIRAVTLLEQRAKDVALKTIEAELDAGYGVFSGAKVQWATLVFTPEAAQWVKDEEWHPAQQASMAADGSLTLKLPYADATELAMDVLRHGEQVRVLSPAKLAQIVEQRLAVGLRQYRADGEGIDAPLIDELRRALEDIAARLTPDADAVMAKRQRHAK